MTKNIKKKNKKQYKSTSKPVKKMIHILKKNSGRDRTGTISVRHRGGRQKRYYRLIDFKRDKKDIKAQVITIEYDPNRTANIALVEYSDGERRYIIQSEGLKIGDTVIASDDADLKIGNALPLSSIPAGSEIHNIELYKGKGGQIVKSAGSFAVILAKDDVYADVKLPSKEIRKIPLECYATLGRISNIEHKLEESGKAGRKRLMGIRPTVRGTAQNPRSHPHGGGEGRSGQGMHPKTPWGKSARGNKTSRRRNKKLLVASRKK